MYLRTRLLLGVLGVVLVSGIFTVAALGTLSEGQQTFQEYSTANDAQLLLHQMNEDVHMATGEVLEYIVTDNPERRQIALEALSRLDNHTQEYQDIAGVPLTENVSSINGKVKAGVQSALAAYDQEGREAAIQELDPILQRENDVMTFYHDTASSRLDVEAARLRERAGRLLSAAVDQFLLGSVVALLLAGLLGVILTRSVSIPIQRLQQIIRNISRGNLESAIDEPLKERDDEIGSLARAFDRTLVSLKLAMKKTAPALEEKMAETEASLEEKQRQVQKLYNQLPLPAVAHTPEGTIQMVNSRFTELLGYSDDELVGESLLVIHPDDEGAQEGAKEALETVREGGTAEKNLEFQRSDGTVFTARIHAFPIEDEEGNIETVRTIITRYEER